MLHLLKRLALLVVGPLLFLFICLAPHVCERRRGFRAWYWRLVPRACGWLLWFLSIRVEISPKATARMAQDENSIFAVNHRSHLDGFALLSNVPNEKWVTFGAKKEFFSNFFVGRGFRAAGLVSIDRARGSDALRHLATAVREMPRRRSLILFPEGTRSHSAGLAPFKAGVVIVAREAERSIRPVVIAGSDTLLPRDRKLPSPGVIRIDVLESFHCDDQATVDADLQRLQSAMSDAYEALLTA
ncbi:lysophospholipid acyltransferase family protein [Tropicimonas sp. TH_r6]|uniref:lysophospholipid acyltransferase family protein n=1 Tax=Tropicimonas sp. TH_r6 TaxID=3082085 RepID=UPI002953B15A|nr:lysophospholipid acyltransferase family protein [Tropicimonas sp. TH_r6]MDV7143543.1 lysophospholipid acyltransferase family protein [Tropicimonas sp. TH_r6]